MRGRNKQMCYKKQTYATKNNNGNIAIINGTRCAKGYCQEYGCAFPACATFSGEEFSTLDQAKQKYPELEIV